MKNLVLISFVGVDTKTSFDELKAFHDKNFTNKLVSENKIIELEYSVLYSEAKNSHRYPDFNFCENFLSWARNKDVPASLHLCGQNAINKYINRESDVMTLCDLARRIQLNINISHYEDQKLLAYDTLATQTLHNHRIILQKNKTKDKYIQHIESIIKDFDLYVGDIHFLHDSSGGFGREITKVVAPHETHFTGYAGGINPENVKNIIKLIEDTNINNKSYYIDMESGIRTDNIFSLEKCQHIIDNILK